MTAIQKLVFAYSALRRLFTSSDINFQRKFLVCIYLTCIIGFMEIFVIYLIAHVTGTALFGIDQQLIFNSNWLSYDVITTLAIFSVLIIFIASSWNVYLLSSISYNSANKIAYSSLNNWFKKPYSRDLMQDSENSYSQAVKNILLDSEGVASNFIIPCLQLISSVSTLALLSLASLFRAPKESFLVLIFVALFFVVVSNYIEPYLKTNSRLINLSRKAMLLAFKESFSTYRLLKFRTSESNQIRKIYTTYRFYTKKLKNNFIIANLPRLAIESISYLLILFLLYIVHSTSEVSTKSIVITQITFLILCLQRLIPLANRCYGYIAHVASNSSSVKEVLSPFMDSKSYQPNSDSKSYQTDSSNKYKKDLSRKSAIKSREDFYWSSIECCFTNYSPSLIIQKGDWVHLSGPSGCGKTSMLESLLLQDSSISNNKIFINNVDDGSRCLTHDLDNYKKILWLSSIAYCPQSPELVSGNLVRNLLYPYKVSPASNQLSSQHKQILEIVELDLPNNLLTGDLGEGAKTLSGGQQQRLVLARELLTNPQLLIIDEGLSGVSEEMENKIYNNIRKAFPGISVVTVSHRFTLPSFFRSFALELTR